MLLAARVNNFTWYKTLRDFLKALLIELIEFSKGLRNFGCFKVFNQYMIT